ncbi:hypothetical protein AGMMS49938_07530 [Fibrobacterales bacterium]|nr:hypothetical protein AGMMS49938_07530 [Fibrobacterales bacterium]
MNTKLKFNSQGLIPAIVQDVRDCTVLMFAWMNEESFKQTMEIGEMVFWSRSRKEIWHKGATSGNFLKVHSWSADCDNDTLLFKVSVMGSGVACHTGERSCFHNFSDIKNAGEA